MGEREDKKSVKGRIGMKITDVRRKVDNQRETCAVRRRCCAKETEKIAAATVYRAYISPLNPASSRAVLSERKMIRIFIRERKTNIKPGQIHFSYADTTERKSGNGPERF